MRTRIKRPLEVWGIQGYKIGPRGFLVITANGMSCGGSQSHLSVPKGSEDTVETDDGPSH